MAQCFSSSGLAKLRNTFISRTTLDQDFPKLKSGHSETDPEIRSILKQLNRYSLPCPFDPASRTMQMRQVMSGSLPQLPPFPPSSTRLEPTL